MLKATILIDNISKDGLCAEWGFSVLTEYNGKKYLLDTGSSDKYLENAEKLNIDLSAVDCAVLSHAHYDHSSGFASFFELNPEAKLYASSNCDENCYSRFAVFRKYIGIPKGVFGKYDDRIEYVNGMTKIDEGVYLVPHIENGLESIGKKARLYVKSDGKLIPDSFCHEQSLVFETQKGLVVMNSCSHGGLENILHDIETYLPGKRIHMTVGGLHLSTYGKAEVERTAHTIKNLNIDRVITGHCTGNRAFEILKKVLGDKVEQTYAGMKIDV